MAQRRLRAARAGTRFFLRAYLNFARHRIADFFENMADESDCTRDDADAAHDLPWQAELARERADGARGIDRKHLAVRFLRAFRNQLYQLHVRPLEPVRAGDFEQASGARIGRHVEMVADARYDAAVRVRLNDLVCQRIEVDVRFGIGHRFLQHARGVLHGTGLARFADHSACHATAHAQQPRGDCRLDRFGRAGIGHACDDGVGRHAVLDESHSDRIEYNGFLRRRNAFGHFQKRHVAEIELAEDVARKIKPVHRDPVGFDTRDVGFQSFAFGHGWASPGMKFLSDGYRCAQPILRSGYPSRVGWVERSDTHHHLFSPNPSHIKFYQLHGFAAPWPRAKWCRIFSRVG